MTCLNHKTGQVLPDQNVFVEFFLRSLIYQWLEVEVGNQVYDIMWFERIRCYQNDSQTLNLSDGETDELLIFGVKLDGWI